MVAGNGGSLLTCFFYMYGACAFRMKLFLKSVLIHRIEPSCFGSEGMHSHFTFTNPPFPQTARVSP